MPLRATRMTLTRNYATLIDLIVKGGKAKIDGVGDDCARCLTYYCSIEKDLGAAKPSCSRQQYLIYELFLHQHTIKGPLS
ncbi:hypothetical protein E2C01_097143 [Portunus trituberculatus]|uniref:Uncharacterized protein n=1 Tax=Portunus trituberculatus TaxID=210409 RepID=A0A5B7K971_PORTR|nr:hypothetical protein [Portunus trituberculatus]